MKSVLFAFSLKRLGKKNCRKIIWCLIFHEEIGRAFCALSKISVGCFVILRRSPCHPEQACHPEGCAQRVPEGSTPLWVLRLRLRMTGWWNVILNEVKDL